MKTPKHEPVQVGIEWGFIDACEATEYWTTPEMWDQQNHIRQACCMIYYELFGVFKDIGNETEEQHIHHYDIPE